MKVNNKLKGIITETILKDILVVIIILIIIGIIVYKLSGNNKSTKELDDGLVVEYKESYEGTIKPLSDEEGLKEKGNTIIVTNNGDIKSYNIELCGDDSKNLKVGIDDTHIKLLSTLDKDENCYIVFTEIMNKRSNKIHTIRLWNELSSQETTKSNYKIKITEVTNNK